ncbi:MAG: starch-binding protein [Alistipes sp.]|nr:starch-binding protein [Alistipes sp.]
MKKLLYSIIALTGLAFASCTQEHIDVQYNPENAVAPTLGAIEGCELSDGGADIVVEYTKADFGVATANAHNLYISKSEDMADMKKAKAAFADATITLTQADLNVVALDFAEAGTEVDLYFAVVANLNTDKGAAVAGTDLMSNVVKATFKSYVADVLPSEKFDKMYVVGTLNGWDHGTVAKEFDFLYNYDAGNSNLYAGIIDLRTPESAAEFKFTDAGGWGSKEHSMTGTNDAEASTVTLVAGGGDNINVWQTKRFYGAELDLGGLTLKKLWSADQIGIIGLNGNWESDIVMEYNAKWTRFYADIDVAEATEMKFRADAAWDINWGVDCVLGGDNIAVPAGQYRVYFNPVTGLIELNAKNFGTEEDTGAGSDTPEVPEGPVTEPDRWGVVGTITGWGNEADLYMSEVGENLFVRNGVTVTADDQFKIRFNNDWAVNYGAAGDVEPFAVTVGEELVLAAGGKNLSAPAGTYDIYFNIVDFKIWVMNEGETPGGVEVKTVKIYGDVSATGWTNCNAWIWDDGGANYTGGTWPGLALETAEVDGKTYYVFNCAPEMIGKTVSVIFNNGSEQTVDIKGVELNDDVVITLTEKDDAGKWLANVNGEAPVTPEPPAETTYGLIGDFNGWTSDVDLVARGDGWYVTEALNIPAEGKLLIRLNDAWDEKYGNDGSKLALGENALTYGGADMWIDAGDYDFYFNPAASKLVLAVAGSDDPTAGADTWSVIGDFQSGNWNSDVVFVEAGDLLVAQDVVFANANNEGLAFKVRKNYSWDTSYGVTDTTARELGAAIVLDGGSNIFVNGEVGVAYDVYFRVSDMTIWVMADGATPAI